MGRFLLATLAALTLATAAEGQTSVDLKIRPDVPAKRCGPLDYAMIPTLGINPKCHARAAAADRKVVTELVAQGHCPEAVNAALRMGDLNFAREVRDFCQSSPTPVAAGPTSPAPATP